MLYLQGGVGSGKTRAFIAPVDQMLTEIPNLRVLWGRQDFNDLKKSIMETFFEILPPDLIVKKNEAYHWYDIEQQGKNNTNTARIYFSGLKDLGGLGSQEFGMALITEAYQVSLMAYRTLKQRVRQSGMPLMILLEGNPPNDDHWLVDLTNPEHPDFDKDIEKWEVSTYENWKNLAPAYTNSLESMPESWKSKYLYGRTGFTPDGKPFYQGFIERIHKRQLSYNTEKVIYRSWDYGYRHPACSFHQIDAKGRWLILREVMGTDITIEKFGNYIKTMCKEWFSNVKFEDYGDPAGEQVSDKSEKTSVEILASLGIFVTSKPSTYRERKEIIERKLATLIEGIPALIVDEGCKVIVDGFLGGYHYQVRKPGQAFNPAIFEVPFRDGYYEHGMNSMEYFAVNQFTGAETKKDLSRITHKVVGPFKDVQITVSNEEDNYGKYQRVSAGVMVE